MRYTVTLAPGRGWSSLGSLGPSRCANQKSPQPYAGSDSPFPDAAEALLERKPPSRRLLRSEGLAKARSVLRSGGVSRSVLKCARSASVVVARRPGRYVAVLQGGFQDP